LFAVAFRSGEYGLAFGDVADGAEKPGRFQHFVVQAVFAAFQGAGYACGTSADNQDVPDPALPAIAVSRPETARGEILIGQKMPHHLRAAFRSRLEQGNAGKVSYDVYARNRGLGIGIDFGIPLHFSRGIALLEPAEIRT